ncbi:MAG TPA: metal-dependent hydrolase [Kofleriaceae bacterium]|nr:metal-dependent hydrolase [Kofleriaceae bacterium]
MAIPIPRTIDVDLASVPRHWMAGHAAATALSNGINMLFPHGERFFVRSVHHYAERITDPELRAQVKAFFKQEGHHAAAHDDYNRVMRAQGFEIDRFLRRYGAITQWIERVMPPALNLAGTAAAEHYTAILAEGAFAKGALDHAHPEMQRLLAWHAAEEIEHRAVAFDVLQQVAPSYVLRMAGLAYATVMLALFWAWATGMLLRQEGYGPLRALRELATLRDEDPVIRRVFVAGIRQYIRRRFHPRDNRIDHLARDWFAAHDLPFTEAA